MFKRFIASVATASFFFLAGAALGQPPQNAPPTESEPPVELPDTTVIGRPNPFPAQPLDDSTTLSANRTASDRSTVGSAVTVISSDEIRQSGQTTVGEVLRGRLGLDVVRSGGPGSVTSTFLRGGNSQHTKVLLDGIPLNDPSNATRLFDFANLGVENIERIEVLRGPQSILYGSDAIGGVINITTKRGDGPATASSTIMAGSFGTIMQGIRSSGGDERMYYSIGGSFEHTDGISQASSRNGNSERDRSRNGTVTGRFGWTPSEQLAVDYVFRYVDQQSEIDSFVFPAGFTDVLDRANLTDAFFQRLQVAHYSFDDLVETKAGVSWTDYDRRDTKPDFGPPQFVGQTRVVDLQSNVVLTDWNVLSVGADYLHEQAGSTTVSQQQQNLFGVYVQDQIEVGDIWYTTVGARWDDHSAAGTAKTYRITSLVKLDGVGAALHGSLGTGFRAPALAQNFFTGGNPNLRPERSKGWDVGVRKSLFDDLITMDVTYFRNDFIDLIDFDFFTFTSQNIGLAQASGIEFQLDTWLTSSMQAFVGYTLNDTEDRQFGGKLARRPQQKASLALSQSFCGGDRQLNLYVYYVGDRLDLPQRFGGGVMDEYMIVNVSGSWRVHEFVRCFARIDNLFDEDYEEARGFGAPGIGAFFGMTLDL